VSRSIVHVRRKKKDADPLRSAWHILEDWLEVNRERIVRIGAIALGLVLVVALLYYFLEYREQQRQQAFADAYEKFTATVGAAPAALPGAAAAKSYPDAQAKYGDAGAAFEALADDYSSYEDVGRYYAGLSYLEIQPDKGLSLLGQAAEDGSKVRDEARLALAEYKKRSGDYAGAEAAYAKLADEPGNMPRFFVLNRLASVKEALGKPVEAAALYKEVVDADRNSQFGTEAEKGLQRTDPVAAAALPPKAPTGGSPSYTQTGPGRAGSTPMTLPPGALPPGAMPPGAIPPGAVPPGAIPGGAPNK
jgi:tetratricopeptide (TPR) repeat protein